MAKLNTDSIRAKYGPGDPACSATVIAKAHEALKMALSMALYTFSILVRVREIDECMLATCNSFGAEVIVLLSVDTVVMIVIEILDYTVANDRSASVVVCDVVMCVLLCWNVVWCDVMRSVFPCVLSTFTRL